MGSEQASVSAIALQHGWEEPSYHQVYEIVRGLPQALVTLAHEGTRTYQEEYDLLYRREAERPNAIWQADHCLLHHPEAFSSSKGEKCTPAATRAQSEVWSRDAGY